MCPLISAASHIEITKERYQRVRSNAGDRSEKGHAPLCHAPLCHVLLDFSLFILLTEQIRRWAFYTFMAQMIKFKYGNTNPTTGTFFSFHLCKFCTTCFNDPPFTHFFISTATYVGLWEIILLGRLLLSLAMYPMKDMREGG